MIDTSTAVWKSLPGVRGSAVLGLTPPEAMDGLAAAALVDTDLAGGPREISLEDVKNLYHKAV